MEFNVEYYSDFNKILNIEYYLDSCRVFSI